jgi:hypothetical protein
MPPRSSGIRRPPAVPRALRHLSVALLVGITAAGCTQEPIPDRPRAGGLVASVASYDLAAGRPTRFIVGLLTEDNLFVSGGSVGLRFFFLGETQAEGAPQLVDEATGAFLPLPGSPTPAGPELVVGPASHGRGVYAVQEMTFERAGIYEVEVAAQMPGGQQSARAAFQVHPEPLVPAPGETAPASENLTVKDRPPEAVDSRAATGPIPDPQLHRSTIADAIDAGRPVLAVFSTPVYCESRFCGPVTDVVAELEADYGDRADFVHVEVWHDFAKNEVNQAAADWLLTPGGDLTEPWVFLIGENGRILARWDNVATRQEIEPWLKRL